MRERLIVASWSALAVTLWVMAYVWPLVAYVLIPFGAVAMAFVVLFLGEGVIREVRGTIRMRLYERRRAEWLARRKRQEASGE
ncbi:hypothetical protein GBF35_25735 [Nonomuraea phyllanthi]|uniref:hypothetical protein n=1 Tax=Nonomuraea phyllanthi TaxID=2219224 RepID=UPI001292DE4F|nr:hypothetical protein [Nonomuraea phyllanthi]QFY09601.1 hypothetical protein GBF35_25735 [Nonomuraea phyllanthi]